MQLEHAYKVSVEEFIYVCIHLFSMPRIASMSSSAALGKVRVCYRKKFQGLSELFCRPKSALALHLDSALAKNPRK